MFIFQKALVFQIEKCYVYSNLQACKQPPSEIDRDHFIISAVEFHSGDTYTHTKKNLIFSCVEKAEFKKTSEKYFWVHRF